MDIFKKILSIKDNKFIKLIDNYFDWKRFIFPTAIVLFITCCVYGKTGDFGSAVLFGTLIAIMFYTWKTWQLKDLTSKQITYNIRPIVVFEPHNFFIRNIGNGVAMNIEIDKVKMNEIEEFKPFLESTDVVWIIFKNIGFLENDKTKCEAARPKGENSKKQEVELPSQITKFIHDSADSLHRFKMVIRYKDIEGVSYVTHMAIKDGRFQVVSIG